MASIIKRHRTACRATAGGRCSCSPTFQARVKPNGRRGKPIIKSFPTRAAAKAWAAEVEAQKARGTLPAEPSTRTLSEAGTQMVVEMRSGMLRARNGETYKPRAIDSYEASLRQW